MKVKDAVAARDLLAGLKISKMEKEDMFCVIKAMTALKKATRDYDAALEEARERLKPEGWDAIVERQQRYSTLKDTERVEVAAAFSQYERDLGECMREEGDKEATVDSFKRLSEKGMGDLVAQNESLSLAQVMAISEAIG